jgi:hypothetical protein
MAVFAHREMADPAKLHIGSGLCAVGASALLVYLAGCAGFAG